MNKVLLIGRLTRDPETTFGSDTQKARCQFTLAVNNRLGADFFRVKVFGKQAEACDTFTHKGSQICVEGRISIDKYEKDGRMIERFEIIADRVEFLDTKAERPDDFSEIQERLPF